MTLIDARSVPRRNIPQRAKINFSYCPNTQFPAVQTKVADKFSHLFLSFCFTLDVVELEKDRGEKDAKSPSSFPSSVTTLFITAQNGRYHEHCIASGRIDTVINGFIS